MVALCLLAALARVVAAETVPRESITFVVGLDDDATHPGAALAQAYYRDDPIEKTDRVIADLATLIEVLGYLQSRPPANGAPWGIVNLVAHGNDAGVLSIPLLEGEGPISPERLRQAIRDRLLAPLPRTILDEQSEIRLIGCALGRNTELLQLIARALGQRSGHRPVIRSSLFYTSFASASGYVFRCLARACMVPMKASERVGDPAVDRRLRSCVREIGADAQAAASRTHPRFVGDSYGHLTEGPFRWQAVFPDATSPPSIETPAQRDQWLSSDRDFRRYLASNRIPWEPERWTVAPGTTADQGASISVRGTVKRLFLVMPLVRQDHGGAIVPLSPSWRDTRYYTAVR